MAKLPASLVALYAANAKQQKTTHKLPESSVQIYKLIAAVNAAEPDNNKKLRTRRDLRAWLNATISHQEDPAEIAKYRRIMDLVDKQPVAISIDVTADVQDDESTLVSSQPNTKDLSVTTAAPAPVIPKTPNDWDIEQKQIRYERMLEEGKASNEEFERYRERVESGSMPIKVFWWIGQ